LPAVLVTLKLLRGPSNGCAPHTKILHAGLYGLQDRRPYTLGTYAKCQQDIDHTVKFYFIVRK